MQKLTTKIQRDGKLPGGTVYRSLVTTKYGHPRRTASGNHLARDASPGNKVVQVGDQPEGFGQRFLWDRKDDEILLAIFVNAADNLGVSIENIRRSDIVSVTSASGIASFDEDTGNPLASSIVGLLAVGAKAGLGIAGVPGVIPVINEVEQFAKERFKATNAKTKRRDAFGVDPGSGHKAKEEGGIIVTLPQASGPFYSGDDEHKKRWIKPDGTRTDENLPEHIFLGSAFFPRRRATRHNRRTVTSNGEIYVLAWDWKFEDNAGFYKVLVHIKKGPPLPRTNPV
jgi:hypothetical protein